MENVINSLSFKLELKLFQKSIEITSLQYFTQIKLILEVSILTGDTVVALLFVCTFVTLSDNVGRNELAPEKKTANKLNN